MIVTTSASGRGDWDMRLISPDFPSTPTGDSGTPTLPVLCNPFPPLSTFHIPRPHLPHLIHSTP
ncbi:hypothetical protein PITC_074710 [Penicillium italicum]|uniref:Uncharacterized protein n=1 Tax=Penicillium italicum TaxID=40296 RepID=A0A0A2LMS6_PENIT|nr:hypothetical protein PITC_074710 [Penicillium italicum]